MNTRPSNKLEEEGGFTVVEVLVAVLALSVGVLAVMGTLVSSGSLSLKSQLHDAATSFAEQQIESLRQQPFASLGMATAPTPSSTPQDPNFYVHSSTSSPPSCYEVQANYQSGGTSTGCEPFVTGGSVSPGAQPITGYQGLSGFYDVYVTWHTEASTNNGCVSISGSSYCLSTSAEKRITVAVWPAAKPGTGTRTAIWVTSVVTDPNAAPLRLPGTGS